MCGICSRIASAVRLFSAKLPAAELTSGQLVLPTSFSLISINGGGGRREEGGGMMDDGLWIMDYGLWI